jgi:glycine/serine hydroxymethyltransferase
MKDLSELFQDIVEETKKHEQYRGKECINMIASEGHLSRPSHKVR